MLVVGRCLLFALVLGPVLVIVDVAVVDNVHVIVILLVSLSSSLLFVLLVV